MSPFIMTTYTSYEGVDKKLTKKKKPREEIPLVIPKTPLEIQKMKLDRLMQNPDKGVPIPDKPKDKKVSDAPEFVRNVMGSSAGAGSGEFHVYRHLRRKEYARQKFIEEKGHKERLDEMYHMKIQENKLTEEVKTAKKRAKRLKKRENIKAKRIRKKEENTNTVEQKDVSQHNSSDQDESLVDSDE